MTKTKDGVAIGIRHIFCVGDRVILTAVDVPEVLTVRYLPRASCYFVEGPSRCRFVHPCEIALEDEKLSVARLAFLLSSDADWEKIDFAIKPHPLLMES